MKQLLLLFLVAASFSFTSKNAKLPVNSTFAVVADNQTTVKWENQEIDLGIIKHQVPKTVEFVFTNTGKTPLIITDVKTSCGCTVAEYPKEPIAPGAKGAIKAMYSAGSMGKFSKFITVTANIPGNKVDLNIFGEVQ
ncbi:MAG: DUF1573 domain-containing protein [Sphingobacteriales bacterium]|nr:MAG: DUF1573 domain-containing protein [Sphingobacteriales bacterium]